MASHISAIIERLHRQCRRFFIAARTPCPGPRFLARSSWLPRSVGFGDGDPALALRHLCRECASRSPCPSATSTTLPDSASTAATATPRLRLSSFAGIPPTKTCMNCHSQIWTNAAYLEPVRASYRSGESLQWTRVNQLPDFVYFNHSIHVNKGVGCNTCHGPVDQMPLMYQQAIAADGVVPGLPPRSRKKSAPARSGFQHALRAAHDARTRCCGWQSFTDQETLGHGAW